MRIIVRHNLGWQIRKDRVCERRCERANYRWLRIGANLRIRTWVGWSREREPSSRGPRVNKFACPLRSAVRTLRVKIVCELVRIANYQPLAQCYNLRLLLDTVRSKHSRILPSKIKVQAIWETSKAACNYPVVNTKSKSGVNCLTGVVYPLVYRLR